MKLTCLLKLRVESMVMPSSLILSDEGIGEPAISTRKDGLRFFRI